jgi:hypothetical protein
MASKVFSGGDKLKEKLAKLSKTVKSAKEVRVGFLENSGAEPNGINTATVAAIQEFGAPSRGIPPRPFFRTMIAKEEGHWGNDLGKILKYHDFDAGKALADMGQEISGELRESIIELTAPELSPVSLLLRQRFGNSPGDITFADVMQARHDVAAGVKPDVTDTQSKPLVWTGHMLDSIDSEVS